MLAVDTPYTTRRKYGRKTSTWITVEYGTVYDRKDTVFVSYTAVYDPYTLTIFNHLGNASSIMLLVHLMVRDKIPSATSNGSVCLTVLTINKTGACKFFRNKKTKS
jgi:hypothetical protein